MIDSDLRPRLEDLKAQYSNLDSLRKCQNAIQDIIQLIDDLHCIPEDPIDNYDTGSGANYGGGGGDDGPDDPQLPPPALEGDEIVVDTNPLGLPEQTGTGKSIPARQPVSREVVGVEGIVTDNLPAKQSTDPPWTPGEYR